MKKEQITELKRLRAEGQGYKKIAKQMNISKDTIHSYCRRHGLSGYGKDLHLCKWCGEPIVDDLDRRKIFCCSACRYKFAYENKKVNANEK